MTFGLGIITTIVAIAGAAIAYFQFVTARRKLMLDLFDRRLKVVEMVERAVGAFQSSGKVTGQNFNDLLTAKAGARFLFGSDVQDYLNSLHRDFAFCLTYSDAMLADLATANRDALIDQKYQIELRLAQQPAQLTVAFGPYLKFTDKQTKPWLPW
ncbi:hypothetical protein IVA96_15585 [Bradyrhizobium sp. 159]|uniref:hypothetical protein n=1 Tax=unclassified Bradyrhizobium TaxID=2631580 RepID=UPI001FF92AA3|nr:MULTISPECIES: hypothetical protein [unclassified Bradyrhizobium]MCK1424577.1 hypothetical protein [Bradyrhizobium sp. CW12]MCK1618040.1 hypothetical protein [Bradyrhizobium sp. 159]MCK1646440.1 hypothetical protein [Bradyrhizobium sp. 154]MCK1758736.1 hypothetical protein [Bradyrhizobium sp. 137]